MYRKDLVEVLLKNCEAKEICCAIHFNMPYEGEKQYNDKRKRTSYYNIKNISEQPTSTLSLGEYYRTVHFIILVKRTQHAKVVIRTEIRRKDQKSDQFSN
ncbi:hypothetical protein LOAG_04365 [Loa loa]|uniref:Uncharacterized protein n=1 Tax=Loa loa TaxID=7209 RepID=A0A1S0U2I9_LOALO|nr:hypothetical protein LOAG_04365 [Loa loa]EFO24117.1 hypothetical protein LOAG_04365 [Loa loa]